MFNYTKDWFEKAISDTNEIGEIKPSEIWTSEYLPWDIINKNIQRNTYKNEVYEILQGNGIVIGKPYDNKYYKEYKKVILKIVRDELGLKELPIMYNMKFGHTAPMITIPYGCIAEIDCKKSTFKILESGVI